MSPLDFTTVGIICKQSIEKDAKTLKSVIKMLEKSGAQKILLDEKAASVLKKRQRLTREELCVRSSLLVTLGGDGTLLKVARSMDAQQKTSIPPILSINIGRLGFLTETTPKELAQKLKLIRSGKYKLDTRALLSVTLKKRHAQNDNPLHHTFALNDAVINQGAFARLIKLGIRIDNLEAASFKADGLIVATPTGSTGHSLSAGGPVIHPKVDGIVITPICPVLLSMRPIVIPDSRTIRIKIETARRRSSNSTDTLDPSDIFFNLALTLDGQHTLPLDYEDEITITRAPQTLSLIRATDRNYFKTLNEKLGWGYER